MSWKKQTINLSKIDKIVENLRQEQIPYIISLLGKVEGKGLNDILENEEWRVYQLRRLDYDNKIMLERIIQTNDIELDDFIISKVFYKDECPDEWYYKIIK